jgi:hypothetical protein
MSWIGKALSDCGAGDRQLPVQTFNDIATSKRDSQLRIRHGGNNYNESLM